MNLRDTLYWSRELTGRRKVVQIDIAAMTLGRDYPIHRGVIGDCREALRLLLSYAGGPLQSLAASATVRKPWTSSLKAVPAFYDVENMNSGAAPVHPARLIAEMRRVLPRETILFVDSGAHRAFAGPYWQSYGPGGVRSATNLGPMGWAIPAAIGGIGSIVGGVLGSNAAGKAAGVQQQNAVNVADLIKQAVLSAQGGGPTHQKKGRRRRRPSFAAAAVPLQTR